MINRIEEIKKALELNMPESALALTLTLPDICAQVEFPGEYIVKKRYVDWLDMYLPKDKFDVNYDGLLTNYNNGLDPKFPKLTPKAIYKLRCKVLHEGNSKIESEVKDADIDIFIFQKMGASDWRNGLYGAQSGYSSYIEKCVGYEKRTYKIDIKYFCETIVEVAENYYENHNNKSDFEMHSVFIENA